jgi:hypothetical protein
MMKKVMEHCHTSHRLPRVNLAVQMPHHLKFFKDRSCFYPLQSGDCFDMAVILASLLIGVGYNAYVVS